jgi:hypothetical protein
MNKYVALIFLFLISTLAAQNTDLTRSQINYGTFRDFHNARSLGMGGSGIAGGFAIHSAMLNPALITQNQNNIEVSALGLVYNLEEDRSYPYYDNFGGFVDYGTYVFNSNTYGDFAINAIYRLPILSAYNLNVGLGYNSLIGFNYDYLEEVRSDQFGDDLLAYNKINSDGIFKEVNVVLGANLIPSVGLGLKLGFLTGSVSQKLEVFPVDEDLQNIHQLETNEISLKSTPLNVNIGLNYRYNEQFSVATIIKFPFTLETENRHVIKTNRDATSPGLPVPPEYIPDYSEGTSGFDSTAQMTFNRKIDYPLTLGIGFDYRFTNILEARIHAEFEYAFWSQFSDSYYNNVTFSDNYAIRLGVEHIFFDKMPFRVGFKYQPLKENRRYTRSVLTLGVGLLFDTFEIDLSGGIESLTTIQSDLFDDGSYPPLESRINLNDRVQTNYFYGMVEVRIELD